MFFSAQPYWYLGFMAISHTNSLLTCEAVFFIGLTYQEGKDIVFRFIIEYSSLKDFGP
jgi:hypothetical protein